MYLRNCGSQRELDRQQPTRLPLRDHREAASFPRSLTQGSSRVRPNEELGWIRIGSPRPAAEEDDLHGVEEDPEVEPEGKVLDVVQVVAHFLDLFFEVVGVAVADLRPPGYPRTHCRAERVIRNPFLEELEVRGRVGPGPHEVHLTADDVDELRELVEAELPQPLPHPGDPMAIVQNPLGGFGRDGMHGAEFEKLEALASEAHAIVDEEHRAERIELDRQGDQTEEGSEADEGDNRGKKAEPASYGEIHIGLSQILGEDETARGERFYGELAR